MGGAETELAGEGVDRPGLRSAGKCLEREAGRWTHTRRAADPWVSLLRVSCLLHPMFSWVPRRGNLQQMPTA